MIADVGPIQHDPSMCRPDRCPGNYGCWCAACERNFHGDAAERWWESEIARAYKLNEAIERIRVHHDKTLGHSPTNRIGYCAEPDGISATYCETGILLAGLR
jgi:hypothetical protein